MEWVEKVKDFFAGDKMDLNDPEVRRQAFLLLSEVFGQARWDEFAMTVRQTIITRHPVQKPSFAEMEAEMREVHRLFEPWLN
jgi:hypothetical protein